MSFSYRRVYRGPVEAVLLDWAGTTMDFGCMAPAVVLRRPSTRPARWQCGFRRLGIRSCSPVPTRPTLIAGRPVGSDIAARRRETDR